MLPANHPLTLADLAPIADSLAQHAQACMPRECCGVVVRWPDSTLQYLPCDNVASGAAGQDRFEMAPAQYAQIEDSHTIVAICHSHPNASANPSEADRVMCERTGLPWAIMGYPSQVLVLLQPSQYQAPLVGRNFHHGLLDCYTLVEDYYQRTLGIALPSFERQDNWWVPDADGQVQDLYSTQFAQAGFVEVDGPPQLHDGLLMQVKSDVLNHAAIYLGNGKILHHLHGRLSCEDVWGGYWQRHTGRIVRHQSLLGSAV
jgi:proteasome lid subunit RPN8/RPN11